MVFSLRIRLLFLIFLIGFYSFAQSDPSYKIAIIGGGMSGVSAAHFIKKSLPNADIDLYEKETQLGGNARTISIKNSDKKEVWVDAGPQYFAEGPWDQYIEFLTYYKVYDEEEMSKFTGTIVIDRELKTEKPVFVTPSGGMRGEKMGRLTQFFKFYKAARKVYLGKVEAPRKIGNWVESIGLKESVKLEIVYPFLASSLGTTVSEIKKTDTKEIVKLFAFRDALKKSEFKISDIGMGTMIQQIGAQLAQNGVNVNTGAEVVSIEYLDELKKIQLEYRLNQGTGELKQYDFVVFATHSYQAASILQAKSQHKEIVKLLRNFKYFTAQIVLHRDSSYVNNEKSSFMNIITNSKNEVVSNTMNLGVINSDLKGIYKSWFTDEDLKKVKSNHTFIHSELFYHPLITPEFSDNLKLLREKASHVPYLYFAGGWSEGLETQETAIMSGKNAALKCVEYFEGK